MKDIVISEICKTTKLSKEEIENLIEVPPNPKMGDYAFPCFVLAKSLKKSPISISEELSKKIKSKEFEKIEAKGGYLNFFVDKKKLVENILKEVTGKYFGKRKKKKEKIVIEFPSPNTNKPLHLGHLRNMALGESISRISEFIGDKVSRVNLNNDRGIHICKSMLAYEEFGEQKEPDKKSDHFVGDFYVKFNELVKKDKSYDDKAQELLQKWESGDKETVKLWKKMNKWALDGFRKTYDLFGIKHDKEFFESKIYKKGKEIILNGLKSGVFEKKEDGSVFVNLENEKLGEKILLRKDGTSVYITQDIYLAELKKKEFDFDRSFYVVGNEQEYHFNVLFSILEKIGMNKEGLVHVSYGMVELPSGKMKSREGTVVDADNLIYEVRDIAKNELEKRGVDEKELEERSLKIALAAIKYFLLKVDAKKNMLFNPKESMNFEGNTGPYVLYSYVRANSILKKVKSEKKVKIDNLDSHEIKLAKKLIEFKGVVFKAYENLNPSYLANYSFELAQCFNEFYHACPVVNSEHEALRLKLVRNFKGILSESLNLLGIETLDEM
ncbi:MAG: arginine--tRNA ligase [Candidatus Pacearchaeota archaeon]|nr:arginine--tRNA ligase [Candidatus Pacearchaeota archaeon]